MVFICLTIFFIDTHTGNGYNKTLESHFYRCIIRHGSVSKKKEESSFSLFFTFFVHPLNLMHIQFVTSLYDVGSDSQICITKVKDQISK